jgi:hypothetical protein
MPFGLICNFMNFERKESKVVNTNGVNCAQSRNSHPETQPSPRQRDPGSQ